MESGVRNSHAPSVKYGCPEEIFMKPRLFQHCFVKNSYIECHEKPTTGLIADTSLHVAGCTDTFFKKGVFFTSYRMPKIQFVLNITCSLSQLQRQTD